MTNKNEVRKLTMEEKRRLEKMIFADIESAESAYNASQHEKRDKVEAHLLANAPAEVRKLFDVSVRAHKEIEQAEKKLDALGYDINNYGGENKLTVRSYDKQPAELEAFDRATEARKTKLLSLKRSYTIKLFAGGAEAQELFTTLEAEIAKLTA